VHRVLIPNRGEIAVRVIKACFDEGLESVAALSEIDMDSLPARLADDVVCLGGSHAADSYLAVERIVAAARDASCDAVHPGYGFLSERPVLAQACADANLTFVGPSAGTLRRAGDKLLARETARACGIQVGGGSPALADAAAALNEADELGYPVMLKASAGGGGRGMVRAGDPEQLVTRFATASAEAAQAFGDGRLYVERLIESARHVEVQVIADRHGNVSHLGERDCSCQRRYQKLIEEAPAPGLPGRLVEDLRTAATTLAAALDYEGACTVEFLVDIEREAYVFLEVNARIQVEHPVTEMVTGIDIVREQLRIARGEPLSCAGAAVRIAGHAIECRVNAEDPDDEFRPTPGRILSWVTPAGTGVRVDTHCHQGALVSPYYDSLLAKVIVHGSDRADALARMHRALGHFHVEGVATTVAFHRELLSDPEFTAGPVTTRWLEQRLGAVVA
jgi:acetyl-CoA carboxylase biotin carboxylase subunit